MSVVTRSMSKKQNEEPTSCEKNIQSFKKNEKQHKNNIIRVHSHCMYCPETDRYFYIIVKHNNAYKLKWLSNKVNGTDKNEFRGCLDREKEKMCKLSANNSNNIFHPIILQSPGYVIFFLDEEIYHDPDVDKQIKIENNNTLLSVKELISLNPIALQTVSFR